MGAVHARIDGWCQPPMIKQPASSKGMKQSSSKNNPNPKGKSKTSWGSGERDGVCTARWNAFPAICICPLRETLDSAVVVIDRMTQARGNGRRTGKAHAGKKSHWN